MTVTVGLSQLAQISAPESFFWATGIEDTFITAPWPATGRTLDEYELCGHYDRWADDLTLMRESGVSTARYGIPWHRVQPSPDQWDWQWADRPLERLLDLGIDPIVDLVHYGLPAWIEGAFLAPDFPRRMAEYASRLAERYVGRIRWYTPLNEPRITAWYCGKLGWWPPNRRGWRGFVALTIAICRGIVTTAKALAAVDPEIVCAHVDATDVFAADHPSLDAEAGFRQEIVFLALDLVSGKVDNGHELHAWLITHGVSEGELAWFRDNAIALPLIGLNLYPMFTSKRLRRDRAGGMRIAMPYADASIVDRLATLYWERYRCPLFIAETASVGSVAKRQRWLDDTVAAVHRVRESGIPLVGYTWWPMYALVTWAYRQGAGDPAGYLRQMGLWDLDPDLTRRRTSLVDAYQDLTRGGATAVGRLGATLAVGPGAR